MDSRQGTTRSPDGVDLAWRIWDAPDPWGSLLMIHGLCEHSGRYGRLGAFLAQQGLSSIAFDLRGHGLSAGARGDVDGFYRFLDDLAEMEREVQRRIPGDLPRFLLGHSLGGLIGLRRLSEGTGGHAGAVLSAPWLRVRMPALVRYLGRTLGGVVPRLTVPGVVSPKRLTADPEMIREWRADPLIHTSISAGLFREAERVQTEILRDLDAARIPLLFLVPGADPVVDSRVTIQFAQGLAGEAVEVQVLPNLRHEPFNEVVRKDVFEMVGAWLVGHRKPGRPPA
jgi:lysophospholipase